MSLTVTVDPTPDPIEAFGTPTRDPIDAVLTAPADILSQVGVEKAFKPNFVVLLVDDIGIEFFEDYDAINQTYGLNTDVGNAFKYPDMRTVRGEAARGIIFDEAHACPTCSPSRYALNTGRYPRRTGLGDVLGSPTAANNGYEEAGSITGTPEISLAQALRTVGYSSAWLGKGHLSKDIHDGGIGPAMFTNQLGYDVFRGTVGGVGSDTTVEDANGHAPGYWNYNWYNSPTNTTEQISTLYATTKLRNHTKGTWKTLLPEPFMMVIAAHAVHSPNGGADLTPKSGTFPSESDAGTDVVTWGGSAVYPYTSRMDEWVSHRAACEALDVVLDSLINGSNGLKDLGLYDRTVIMIVGDNGSAKSIMQAGELFGESILPPYKTAMDAGMLKGSVFRMGSRIPLIISGPPEIMKGTAGRRSSIQIDIVDIWSTIMELAGANVVNAVGTRPIDGISFAPSLWHQDADAGHKRTSSFQQAFTPNGDVSDLVEGDRHDKRVRFDFSGGRYSYITTLGNALELLFDLDADPLELATLPLSGPIYDAGVAAMALYPTT